jgi:hypothetical protein
MVRVSESSSVFLWSEKALDHGPRTVNSAHVKLFRVATVQVE